MEVQIPCFGSMVTFSLRADFLLVQVSCSPNRDHPAALQLLARVLGVLIIVGESAAPAENPSRSSIALLITEHASAGQKGGIHAIRRRCNNH